ncbi:hypothetical protein T484DRAFT_1960573 [Baffinella frigidus]|nr:hypothetical protein T484DRAFT_1960573 [Cryptophyta sp. CCMP2293]|mmetsp:Transcript_17673/g.42599  ORF Transcript_17673/g.42599 Transcript_17673/m.42599 type:complete len:183 (+) Transcript_17673:87-635(+)
MTTLGIINPKKRREIEGVGGQSLVDLKSTLFKAEDEAKRAKASGVPVSGGKLVMKAPVRNKGVEEREARDLAQADKRLDPAESLGVKMEQYHQMAGGGFRDDKEKFLVDFEQKRWDADSHHPAANPSGDVEPEAVLGRGGDAEGVLRELGEQTRGEKDRMEALKAKRVEAAKKRMQAKKAKG